MNKNTKNIVSCGGVVIYKNKVLTLYKNQNGRHMGWVLPKGSVEPEETFKHTALREVREEAGVDARIIKYLGKTQYTFTAPAEKQSARAFPLSQAEIAEQFPKIQAETAKQFLEMQQILSKTVHWYLMTTNSFQCKPQAEEFFADAGFYKQHEAYHLLKYHDERQIMRRAFVEYAREIKNKIKQNERMKAKCQD